MPRRYEKLSEGSKRVSFDESARIDFGASESSLDDVRPLDASLYHAPENNKDESDDEVDNLLSDDPLYDEKSASQKRTTGRKRLSRKSRKVLIFGLLTVFLGIGAGVIVLAVQAHSRSQLAAQHKNSDAGVISDQAAMEEVQGMTEVPSLAGILPLGDRPIPISPVTILPEDQECEQIISVPATTIDWNSESSDKAAYEADMAADDSASNEDELISIPVIEIIWDDGEVEEIDNEANQFSDPPELSEEAVSQAQGLSAQLDESSAQVAVAAEDSASKIKPHKGDPVDSMKTAATDIWAWISAKWADALGNTPSGETVY